MNTGRAPDIRGPLSFPRFVIGPESQGRGYRLLAPDTLSFTGARDLAMILMEWSRVKEQELVGCLPVPGAAAVLFRARYIGREALGEAAYLHGILLSAADLQAIHHRTELLLPLLGRPDGSTRFADAPVQAAPYAPRPPRRDWAGLGLAWRNRLIVSDPAESREEVLVDALASIDPPEQRARIRGWVTSTQLESRGALNPLGESQLIVASAPFEDDLPGFQTYFLARSGDRGSLVEPPGSLATWQAFGKRYAAMPAFTALEPALKWELGYATLSPRETAEEALRIATGVLGAEAMVDLLIQAFVDEPVFAEAARDVAQAYGEALGTHDMTKEALRRLLLAPNTPAEVVGPLLHSAWDAYAEMKPKDLTALLGAAVRIARKPELMVRSGVRQGLTYVLKAMAEAGSKKSDHVNMANEVIDYWPEETKTDLIVLTSPEILPKMLAKSADLGWRLVMLVLRPESYDLEVGGEIGVVLRYALHARILAGSR